MILATPAGAKPLKVFILCGQSNMEGQGLIELDGRRGEGYKKRGLSEEAIAKKRSGALENLVNDPKMAEVYKHIFYKDDGWLVRHGEVLAT